MDILGQFEFPVFSGTYGFRSTELICNSKTKPVLEFRFDLKDVAIMRGDIQSVSLALNSAVYNSKTQSVKYTLNSIGKSYPREYFSKFTPEIPVSYLRTTLNSCNISWKGEYVNIELDISPIVTNIPIDYICDPRFCLTFKK